MSFSSPIPSYPPGSNSYGVLSLCDDIGMLCASSSPASLEDRFFSSSLWQIPYQIMSLLAVSQQCCRHPWPLFMQQRQQNTGDLFFSSKIPPVKRYFKPKKGQLVEGDEEDLRLSSEEAAWEELSMADAGQTQLLLLPPMFDSGMCNASA
ncbi:hypothetical protein MUK42_34233 [Musa troglodytarum]|uniref:Uncharacterized protein n=1 Tax=Musa troglodytarum TaxID=320322 RepID=A0A9E7E9C8_9LILI|nr:hypothetical protein MUK42_34233 [Musa troglodytarum]